MQFFCMDQLHEQEFISLLVNAPSNVGQTCFHSCASPTTGAWLLTRLSTLSFHLSSTFSYNIPYVFQYTTSYSSISFMMQMWSYHWWFGYPFTTSPVREWTHYNPWYTLKYHCNYRIEKWSSHTKKGFSPFPSPHMKTSGYHHHQRQLLNPSKHCHWQSNSYRFSTMDFNNDNICNDDGRSRQGTILHKASAKKWLHSPCHRDLQLSPSLFWFLYIFLCTCMYSSQSIDVFGTFDAYISL
jgi:hypothetical protein